MENDLVIFCNTYIKLCYYHLKDTNISYLETTNHLAKNSTDKLVNKINFTLLNYLEPKKLY